MIDILSIRIGFHIITIILAIFGAYISYKIYNNLSKKPKESLILAFGLPIKEVKLETKLKIIFYLCMCLAAFFYILEKIYPEVFYFVVLRGVLSLLFAIGVIYVFTRWYIRLEKIGKEWK
ncbi:MAG: hypothetical protein QXS69_03785 [Candidatus Aenigmatarchaeota archaeon]